MLRCTPELKEKYELLPPIHCFCDIISAIRKNNTSLFLCMLIKHIFQSCLFHAPRPSRNPLCFTVVAVAEYKNSDDHQSGKKCVLKNADPYQMKSWLRPESFNQGPSNRWYLI